MSLRKKTTMTQEKIPTNRANGKRSCGPATPAGRERIRAAHIRHGLYSEGEAAALTCLGEDPAELESLRNDLHDRSQASAPLRKEQADHLVQMVWRWKRAGRGQEGFALRLPKEIFGIGMSSAFAPPAEVAPASSRSPQSRQDASATPQGQQDIGATTPGRQDAAARREEHDKQYPGITAAEWEARERPRQLLENILNRQVEICEAQRQAILKESLAGPSPYERAAEIAPTHCNAPLVRGMQDSNFRELRRVTNLLLKIQRRQRQVGAVEQHGENPGSAGRKLSRHGRGNRA
ncbi:MAG: hypothetical protein WAO35_04450 [Terriglobia bacterium]